MEGPLAACEDVRMLRIEIEAAAAILQLKAHSFHGNARSEVSEDALNPTGDIAILIDHGEIGCVAAYGFARRNIAIGAIRVDQRCAFLCIIIGKQPRDGRIVCLSDRLRNL